MKLCTSCGQVKPFDQYHKNKSKTDGYAQYCRDCSALKHKAWRDANPEKVKATTQKSYEKNKKQKLEYHRKYRSDPANRERERELARLAYVRNHQKIRERKRKHYRDNIDKYKEYRNKWYYGNLETNRLNKRLRQAERRAKQKNVLWIFFTEEQFRQKMLYWNNECWLKTDLCKKTFDAVDHVKPIDVGGSHILANLRPICQPCNSSKHNNWPIGVLS